MASNLTVKKYDGTTDITYTNLTGAAGDRSPAVWRSNDATGTLGQKPKFTLTSRSSGDGKTRRLDGRIDFPSVYTDSDSGLTMVRSTANFSFSVAVPQDIAAVDLSEFAAQACNLIKAAMPSAIVAGYAPA